MDTKNTATGEEQISPDSVVDEHSHWMRNLWRKIVHGTPKVLETATDIGRNESARGARIGYNITSIAGSTVGGIKNILGGFISGYQSSQGKTKVSLLS